MPSETTVRLTKRYVDGAKYRGQKYSPGAKSRDVRWDDQLSGFGLRIYPSGKKSFILTYRHGGLQRLVTLGQYPSITLYQARSLAQKYRGMLAEGKDPQEVKRKDAASRYTMAQLCGEYLERYAKPHKKSWKGDDYRIQKHILPTLGRKPVREVSREKITTLHNEIGSKQGNPYEANRTLSLLARMFELAKLWGHLEDSAANPAHGVKKFPERKRDRWITPEELPRLMKAIDSYVKMPSMESKNEEVKPYIRYVFWLYLLTGLRRNELLRAKWEDVNLERGELRLPDTKAGRSHVIPLTPTAQAILKEIPRQHGNPYIFPGTKPGRHLVNVNSAWRKIRKSAGLEDVRIHDLRRSVASWLVNSGTPLPVIQHVLNHSTLSATQVYTKLRQDPIKSAFDIVSRIFEAARGLGSEADVVDFPGRSANGEA